MMLTVESAHSVHACIRRTHAGVPQPRSTPASTALNLTECQPLRMNSAAFRASTALVNHDFVTTTGLRVHLLARRLDATHGLTRTPSRRQNDASGPTCPVVRLSSQHASEQRQFDIEVRDMSTFEVDFRGLPSIESPVDSRNRHGLRALRLFAGETRNARHMRAVRDLPAKTTRRPDSARCTMSDEPTRLRTRSNLASNWPQSARLRSISTAFRASPTGLDKGFVTATGRRVFSPAHAQGPSGSPVKKKRRPDSARCNIV